MENKKLFESLFADDSLSELSEDFKKKAAVIFENAVDAKVAKIKKSLKEEYSKRIDEQQETIEQMYEDKIDEYLTYAVEEWMKENQLAIENGIQVEIAENFLSGMKTLFEENYVEIPEDKIDVVSEMTTELDNKTKALDNAIKESIKLKKELNEMKKKAIIAEVTEGLAESQKDKVDSLVEMVDFENEEQYKERVSSIVETYFKSSLNEDMDSDNRENDEDEDDDEMKKYIEALSLSANL